MSEFKLLPKQKSSLYQSTNNGITNVNTSPLQDSILPAYSTVNSNPNDYPSNSQFVIDENVKIYSKTKYSSTPAIFSVRNNYLSFSIEKSSVVFKIELFPPLQVTPVKEITLNRANTPTVKVRVLAPLPKTHDKSTR